MLERALAVPLVALVLVGAASGSAGSRLAAPAHVVFTSDRDGDDDLYAVGPAGGRLAALTRTRTEETGFLSPDGTRLVAVRGNGPSASRMVLLSPDGRSETPLGAGTPVRFLTGDRLAFQWQDPVNGSTSVGEVGLDGSGRRMLALNANDQIVGWWPDGSRFLVLDAQDELVEVAFPDGARTVAATGVYVAGLSDLGLVWFTQAGDQSLHAGDLDRPDSIASLPFADVLGWSPAGGILAYLTGSTPKPTLTLYDPATGRSTQLASLPGRVQASAWAPDGSRLALVVDLLNGQGVAVREEVVVAATDGSAATVVGPHTVGFLQRLAWSPDGTMLAYADDYRVFAVPAGGGAPHAVSGRGNALLVGWAQGPVPATAPPARPLPSPEVGSPRALRTVGRIVELAASGRWAAVSVVHDPLDCDHVAAWRAGTRRTARFSRVAPCQIEWPADVLSHLRIAGTTVTWWDTFCEAACESTAVRGDLRAPGAATTTTADVRRSRPPARLIAHSETRGGVTLTLRHGTLVLRHAGRSTRIGPPGVVDGELTTSGLFYAYDVPGSSYRGRVVFTPRAALLRALR